MRPRRTPPPSPPPPPPPPANPAAPSPVERRRNRTLREVLEELVTHVRDIARRARGMSGSELEYAQQRLEWLADEVWRLAVKGEDDPRP